MATKPNQRKPPRYEVLPSRDLPLLDLSRSVGNVLAAYCRGFLYKSTRVGSLPPPEDAELERTTRGRVIIIAYVLGHLLGAVVCVVPKSIGSPLAIAGLMLTLPGSFYSLLALRFDVAKLLMRSYDLWFYTFVNTAANIFVGYGLSDVRACIAIILWLGNLHACFVDANTKLMCYLVQASAVTMVLNAVLVLLIWMEAIDGWHRQFIRIRVETNGHVVDCDSLILNGLLTMVVLLGRNVLRRHRELAEQKKTGCPMMRCINLRSRVTAKLTDKERIARLQNLSCAAKFYYVPAHQLAQTRNLEFPWSLMAFVRYNCILDAGDTFYPVTLSPLQWRQWERLLFASTGVTGLALTTAAFVVYPSSSGQAIAISGLCCSMLFVGLSMGLLQRQAFRKIVTSFDFIFVSFQISFGLWCASQLFHWDMRSIAAASMWLWLHWALTIDALLPLMKEKIGFNTKMLLVPVLVLFLAAELAMMLEIVWLGRWGLVDQELFALSSSIRIRVMPFFVSRVVMSFLWALRLVYRVLTSKDNDEAVILLGRVGYLYRVADSHLRLGLEEEFAEATTTTTKTPQPPATTSGSTSSTSRAAQVAPLDSVLPKPQ